MIPRALRILAVATAILGSAPLAPAQSPVLYRLDPASEWTEGCFDPCACPIFIVDDLLGTMTLTFDHADPAGFDHYRVERLSWLYTQGPDDHYVCGVGEYLRGGQVVLLERLTLDLSVDGETAQTFDSGLRPASAAFPAIDVEVSLHGMVCFDTVFRVAARPVPVREIVPYVLKRSAYAETCVPPCVCVPALWRTQGTFGLVALGAHSTAGRQDLALVDVTWATQPSPPARSWTGQGLFTLDASLARQRLVLDLVEPTNGAQRFDSGWIPDPHTFPRIDVDAAVGGPGCFDFVHKVHARPQ